MLGQNKALFQSLRACLVCVVATGCGPEIQVGEPVLPATPGPVAPIAEADGGTEDAQIAALVLSESDFVESDSNRDPFRDYAEIFVIVAPPSNQREVEMSDVAVNALRLTSIVTGIPNPRAQFVGPDGVGHTIKRGDYVGRAETVNVQGAARSTNWRIERIRSNEVVLVREDGTASPLRRVIHLHEGTPDG